MTLLKIKPGLVSPLQSVSTTVGHYTELTIRKITSVIPNTKSVMRWANNVINENGLYSCKIGKGGNEIQIQDSFDL